MMLTDKTKTSFQQAGIKPQNKIKVLLRSSKVHVAFFMTKAVFLRGPSTLRKRQIGVVFPLILDRKSTRLNSSHP